MLRVIAAVAFSILNNFRSAWIALAVVPFPGSLNVGVGGVAPSVGTSEAVSTHDAAITAVALAIEIALFLLVPLCLRARRHKQIRSAIRITYDSRRQQTAADMATIHAMPANARKEGAKVLRMRLVGGWGERRASAGS